MACAKHVVRNAKAARAEQKAGLGARAQRLLFNGKTWKEMSKPERMGQVGLYAATLPLAAAATHFHYSAMKDAPNRGRHPLASALGMGAAALGGGIVGKNIGERLRDRLYRPRKKG